jgi:hypothetical protein
MAPRRAVAGLVALLSLLGSTVRAERIDGRVPRPDPRKEALLVPRLLLAPLRLVFRGLALGVGWAMRFNERHRIVGTVLDALTSDDGLIGVRLALDVVTDLRPMGGLSFYHLRAFGKDTGFGGRAMSGGPELIVIDLWARPLRPTRFTLDLDTQLRRRDDQIFQGIVSLTPPEVPLERTRFSLTSFDFAVRVGFHATSRLRLGLLSQLGVRRYADGRPIDSGPSISQAYCVRFAPHCPLALPSDRYVPGFNTGSQFVRGGLSVTFDARDNPARPARGLLLDARATYTRGLDDPSSYFTLRGTVAGYIDLNRGLHVLMLRLRSDMVLPAGNDFVPFTELAILGGADDLRGFAWGRFRDYGSILATVELRWHVWLWADAVLFADYGGTFGKGFSGFSFDRLYPDVGAGVRIRTSSRVLFRVQAAYGFPDGLQFYLTAGAALP